MEEYVVVDRVHWILVIFFSFHRRFLDRSLRYFLIAGVGTIGLLAVSQDVWKTILNHQCRIRTRGRRSTMPLEGVSLLLQHHLLVSYPGHGLYRVARVKSARARRREYACANADRCVISPALLYGSSPLVLSLSATLDASRRSSIWRVPLCLSDAPLCLSFFGAFYNISDRFYVYAVWCTRVSHWFFNCNGCSWIFQFWHRFIMDFIFVKLISVEIDLLLVFISFSRFLHFVSKHFWVKSIILLILLFKVHLEARNCL